MSFDPDAELSHLRELRTRKLYRASKLDRFKPELAAMFDKGASATELQYWLARNNLNVSLSTVTRWMKANGHIR